MSNMSYCRFENTYKDLADCIDHMNETDLSETENLYRKKLIEACKYIVDESDRMLEDSEEVE